jgi:hypothetical protein
MARRRRYYIPITRSGSSMLASLLTQWIRQPREQRPLTSGDLKALWFILGAFAVFCGMVMCSK